MSVDFSIRNDYNIVYQSSQIGTPEEAKIFIIGERHPENIPEKSEKEIAEKCRELNAVLIDKYAQKNSVLFVEGRPSMEDLYLATRSNIIRKTWPGYDIVDEEEFLKAVVGTQKTSLINELAKGMMFFKFPVSLNETTKQRIQVSISP
jgi:hypothetical protein